jgi:hypothetical protein
MKFPGIVSVLLLLGSQLAAAETQYFRSNVIGMPFEQLSTYRSDEYSYVLEIDQSDRGESRVLYRDGEEIKRWIVRAKGNFRTTQYYEDGELSSETQTQDGKLMREEAYTGGELVSVTEYQYEGDALRSVIMRNPDGQVVSELVYARTSQGKLRSVITEGDDGSQASSYTYGDGAVIGEWHGEGEEGNLLRYSGDALLAEEKWGSEGIESITEYEYGDTVVSHYRELGADVEEYTERDQQDRPIFVRKVVKGILVEEKQYRYENDRLASLSTRTPLSEETVFYEYDGDTLREERYVSDGEPVLVRRYEDSSRYSEDIYKDGIPVLRFNYEEGVRVGEEDLTDQ